MMEFGWDRNLNVPNQFLMWVRDVDLGQCVHAVLNVKRQNNSVSQVVCPVQFISDQQDYRVVATLDKTTMPGNSNVGLWLDLTMQDGSAIRSPESGELNVRRNDL